MPDNSTKFNENVKVRIPNWINKDFFVKVLKRNVPEFLKILEFRIIPATPPGENSTSLLMRIIMDIELSGGFTQQVSYILKTMLEDDKGGVLINRLNIFPKEKLMYERIIQQLEQIYEEIDRKVKFAPKCHWLEDKNGRITLILQDLQTKKFKNINRHKGFDMPHMERVLEKLAEFHAAGVVWRERNGAFPEEFQKTYLPANYHKSKSYQVRVHSFKMAMANWGLPDHEDYIRCIPTAEQFVNAAMNCFNTDPQEFKVLNHGDFWSSNIMLNYTSTGAINQICFVDFQMCKWGSPAQDLWELIICSTASNLRIKYFDYFIYKYHTHLIKYLKILNYGKPLPKLRAIHMDMLKYGFWGYFTTFTHLVLILLPAESEGSLLKLMQSGEEGDQFRMKAFTNPLYVRAVLEILPFLLQRGILDF